MRKSAKMAFTSFVSAIVFGITFWITNIIYWVGDWGYIFFAFFLADGFVFLVSSCVWLNSYCTSRERTTSVVNHTSARAEHTIASLPTPPSENIRLERIERIEQNLDKEIALLEKRKKLAQLRNEVINLERDSLQTLISVPSSSSN